MSARLLLLILWPVSAEPLAANADLVPELLTADEAVRLALLHSSELAALVHRVAEEEANVDVALRINNPQLRIGELQSDRLLNPVFEDRPFADPVDGLGFGFRWSPPNLGSRSVRRDRAKHLVDQQSAQLEQAKRDLIAEVRQLHASTINLDEQIALQKTAIELRDEMRQLIARRVSAHASTSLDLSFAELDFLDAKAEQQELESRRQATYQELLDEIGLPPGADVHLVVDETLTCRVPVTPVDALVAEMRAKAPELSAARARLDEVDAEIMRTRLELIPWFDYIELSYVLGEGDEPFSLAHPDCSDAQRVVGGCDNPAHIGFRFALTLPLFDWKGAELRALQARKAAVAADYETASRSVEGRVRRTADELKSRVALYERYRESDSAVVDASLEQIRKTIEAGEADLVQLAFVQRRALSTRRDRLRAKLSCQRAVLELTQLVGAGGFDTR